MNESFTHVQQYIVAVIKPPVTWEKFDLPGWQILLCDCSKIEHERRMSHLVPKKKRVKAVFSMSQIISSYIHWVTGQVT